MRSLLDNLQERSASFLSFRAFKAYEKFHMRYLNFAMRQFVWKGVLLDNEDLVAFKANMSGPNAVLFKNSPDEPLILHDAQRIFNQTEWTGNLSRIIRENDENVIPGPGNEKLDPIQIFVQIIVYTHSVLGSKTLFKESLMHLLVPLIHVFRNYQQAYRQ